MLDAQPTSRLLWWMVYGAVVDGKGVINVAAAHVQEAHARVELLTDGQRLALGRTGNGLKAGAGVVGTGNTELGKR